MSIGDGYPNYANVFLKVGMIMWKQKILCPDCKFAFRIITLLILLLLLLPLTACKTLLAPAIMSAPLPICHKYFQSGTFLIGSISSQVFMPIEKNTYEVHPCNQTVIGDIM